MLVTVTGFGSVWRWRLRKAPGHPQGLADSAYYNTTGVNISGSVCQRPKIIGYARFNGRGEFDPNHPSRIINRVFGCADPCVWQGQNEQIAFQTHADCSRTPGFSPGYCPSGPDWKVEGRQPKLEIS